MGPRRWRKGKKKGIATYSRLAFLALLVFSEKSRQVWSKLGPKTEPRSKKNVLKNQCIFWCMLEAVLGWISIDFRDENGAKLGPKLEENRRRWEKSWKQQNTTKTNTKTTFFDIGATKFSKKSDTKSMKNWSVYGKRSWCRFLINFGRFWEPSWGRKSIKNRLERWSKIWWKKEWSQDGSKIEKWRPDGAGDAGLGRREGGRREGKPSFKRVKDWLSSAKPPTAQGLVGLLIIYNK